MDNSAILDNMHYVQWWVIYHDNNHFVLIVGLIVMIRILEEVETKLLTFATYSRWKTFRMCICKYLAYWKFTCRYKCRAWG